MRFPATWLTGDELRLQAEVRAFLAEELPPGSYRPGLGMSAGRDPAFSRKLGARGWLGMSLPREYGGGQRSLVERFIVVEELLRVGAPLGFHWVADRQSGPGINRFGTPEQKRRFLPGICRGELCFAIGMSEPDAGSDLSSLRTAATRVEGGWLLNGTKVWTSGAAACDWLILLARTSHEARPQAGLTQFLVDRRSPGLTVRPIAFIDGTSDFCEVSLRDVPVPDELVLGGVGDGWTQNTAELAYERGGPDRLLSNFTLLHGWLSRGVGLADPAATEWLGTAVARYWGLRNLSLSIARLAAGGHSPVAEAALVKELATRFEQEVTGAIADLYGHPPSLRARDPLDQLLARAVVTGPAFTIRGGTTEILRTVAARELTRAAPARPADEPPDSVDPALVELADRIFADTLPPAELLAAEETGWAERAWRLAADAGLPWLSIPEDAGGPGGSLADALAVLHVAGRRCAPLPLAETGLLGGWLLGRAGQPLPGGPVSVVPGDRRDTLVRTGSRLTGRAHGVAWAAQAEAIVALLSTADGGVEVVICPAGGFSVEPGANLAGEPRDVVAFHDTEVIATPAPSDVDNEALWRRGALSRVALIAGALAATSELTLAYTEQRVQFGRPINRFQAVQHHLVDLAQQAALARMAAEQAGRAVAAGDGRFEVRSAAVIAAAAAAAGARAAHQAHGAMGMTREYPLQFLTRRLWSWRAEYLSTHDDARWLGRLVHDIGPDRLYPVITAGSAALGRPAPGEVRQ